MNLRLYLLVPFLFLSLLVISCDEVQDNASSKPSIVNFAPSASTVSSGAEVTLSWTVNDATSLSIDNGVGDVTGTSTVVRPTATTTYTLTATNTAGDTTARTTVTVETAAPGSPTINSFTATPDNIAAGGTSTLSWDVTGATSLSIDNGVGPVTGTSTVVNPTVTTTYTLEATNDNGTVRSSEIVIVGTDTGGDTTAPTGDFGVSKSQNGPFQSDSSSTGGFINSADDSRIIDIAPGDTFYAQVSYSDPSGISAIELRLVNSNPEGISGPLSPSQEGFSVVGEPTGADCDLSSAETDVTCIYEISVDNDVKPITTRTNQEFAYIFRARVTDTANNQSNDKGQGSRGYVNVEAGSGTPTTPPANSAPKVSIDDVSDLTLSDDGNAEASLDATVIDAESDTFNYQWSVSSGEENNVSFDSPKEVDSDVTFSVVGDYTLKLTATDKDDASSVGSATVDITVKADDSETPPTNTDPQVTIADVDTLTLGADGNVTTRLEASVSDDESDTFTYQWSATGDNAGDVSFSSDTTEDTNATFSAAGSYTLRLVVTDDDDSDSTGSATVAVTVNAADDGDDTPAAPTVDSFTASETTLTAGESTTLSWTLGGGDPDTLALTNNVNDESLNVVDNNSIEVSPTATTTYTLTATNAGGDNDKTVEVTVNPAPEVTVTITPQEATLKTGGTLSLTATVSNSNNKAVTWTVEENGGSVDNANANQVTYTAPDTAGTYTLTATSDADTSKSDSVEIIVNSNQAPTAAFTSSPDSPVVGDTVTLDGTSSDDPDGENSDLAYTWSLTVPENSTAALSATDTSSPTFVADIEGDYVVTLNVTDEDSISSETLSKTISVSAGEAGNN